MANDGSIEITITGDAEELKKEIEAVSKTTQKQTTQAQKSTKSVKSETDTLKKSLEILGTAGKNAYNGLKTVGETAMKTLSSAVATADAAISAVGAAVISVGSNFEAAISEVEAISGATSKEMEMLESAAISAGASTVFSASEAAAALKYMSLAGWDAEKSAKELDGVLSLAAASGMDLASASDMVTDYLSAFSNSAITAAEFADLLAYAQSNSNTTAEQLGEAYKNCAANLNAAGQDVQTVTSLLEAMANQGLKGSEAGTKLKAMMRDLTSSMEDGKITINGTAIAVQDSKGNFRDLTAILTDVQKATKGMGDAEKAAALSAIFTDEAVSGLNLILNEGVDKIAGYEKELRNCEGTAAEMADTMTDNLQGDITLMNSALESFGIAVYQEMNEPLREIVQTANGYVGQLSEAFSKGGFEGVVKEAGNIIPEVITAISKQAPKLIDLGFTLLDGIIEGIQKNSPALTETGLKIVTQIFDGIKNMSTNLMPLVGDFANVFVQGVLKYKDVFWSVAFDMVTAIAQGLSDHADEITTGIVTLVNNIVTKMDESLPVFIEAASNLLINVFETLAENMPDIADNVAKMLSNIGGTLLNALPTVLDAATELIISLFDTLADNMPDIADDLSKMITKICDLLAKNLPKIIDAAGKFLEAFINELLGHADEIFNSVSGIISSLFTSFTKLTPKVQTIVTLMAALYAAKGVANVLRAIENVQGKIQGLFSLISKHPIGFLIIAATTALGFLQQIIESKPTKWDETLSKYREENAKLAEEENALAEKLDEAAQKYDEYKSSRDSVVDDTSDQWEYYGTLWDKLQSIVDQNGKVKTGQDEVAKGITEKLKDATGVEFTFKDGMIEHYEEVCKKMDDALLKQQALALQSGLSDSYITAKTSLSDAAADYATATENYNNKKTQVDELLAELANKQKAYEETKEYYEEHQYDDENAGNKQWEALSEYKTVRTALAEAIGLSESEIPKLSTEKDSISSWKELVENSGYLDKWESDLKNASNAYFSFLNDIDQYESLEDAINTGNTKSMQEVVDNINNHLIKAETGTKQQLENQLSEAERRLKSYRSGLAQGLDGITQDTVTNAENFVKQAKAELAKYNMQSVVDEYDNTEIHSKDELGEMLTDMDGAIEELEKSIGTSGIDEAMVKKYKDARKDIKAEYDKMETDYEEHLAKMSNAEKLAEYRKLYDEILTSYKNDTNFWRDAQQLGSDMLDGIIEGLNASSKQEDKTKAYMLENFVKRQREIMGINSPSKVTKKLLGEPMGQGITIGNAEAIKEGAKDVEKALNDDLLSPLSKKTFTLSPNVILSAQQAARSTAQRAASSVTTTNIHNITNNAYQQAQQTGGEGYVQESVISFERGVNDLVDFLAPKIETRTRRKGRKAVAKLG